MAEPVKPDVGGFVAAPRDDLCLAFANTLSWRGCAPPTEDLHGLDDLLAWTAANGGAHPALIDCCRAQWHGKAAGERAFTEAIALRETLYSLFAAIADDAGPPANQLAALNHVLKATPARTDLRPADAGCAWHFHAAASGPALLAPVLWSAGDLLTGPRRSRVRSCANEKCRWLFLDDSKSGNRRWCSMSACGNRAKAHRHYLKQRAGR